MQIPLFPIMTTRSVPKLEYSQAQTKHHGRLCGWACFYQTETYHWEPCDENTTLADCRVKKAERLGTLALCVDDYCADTAAGWDEAVTATYASAQLQDFLKHAFETVVSDAYDHLGVEPLNTSLPTVQDPFKMKASIYSTAFRSVWAVHGPRYIYPPQFATLTLAAAALACLIAAIRHYYRGLIRRESHWQRWRSPWRRSLALWANRYIFLPAWIGQHTAYRPSFFRFTFSIPTRPQGIALMIYILLNILACLWGIDPFRGNIIFPSPQVYLIKALADSTGIVAVFQMPLLFLTFCRNNVLLKITGLPFSTFNFFHRWIGRVVIFESILHSILYTHRLIWHRQIYLITMSRHWALWGVLATVACSLMLVQAVHIARVNGYELFLVVHIILSAMFIVGFVYHLMGRGYWIYWSWDAYMNWLLIAFSFWVIDRLLRVVALAWRNIALRSLCSGRVSHANVRQIAPDLYELSISLVRHWQFVEGQYVFLHLPGGFNWLQSHPFSILDYSNADSSELGNLAAEPRPLRILARSKLGITKGFKAFSARPAIPVLLEGPYGPSWSLPLDDFDNITFVSGGVGFAAVFAFAKRAGSRGRHKKLHLVLVVRTSAEYHGLLPYLDEVHPSVWRSIFITEPSVIEAHPTSEETSLLTISEEYHPAVSTVTSRGRPSLHNLLCEDAEGKGSFAVVACGPGRMLDELRTAVVDVQSQKQDAVELFIEAFEWS